LVLVDAATLTMNTTSPTEEILRYSQGPWPVKMIFWSRSCSNVSLAATLASGVHPRGAAGRSLSPIPAAGGYTHSATVTGGSP
jgi:hypothetical protein